MKDQKHRDIITDLYRIYETYEILPQTTDDTADYFKRLVADLRQYELKHNDPVATKLSFGLLEGLSDAVDMKLGKSAAYAQKTQQMAMALDK